MQCTVAIDNGLYTLVLIVSQQFPIEDPTQVGSLPVNGVVTVGCSGSHSVLLETLLSGEIS